MMDGINCPLKNTCWRLSYARYLVDVGYTNEKVPIRYILFQAGYCNLVQMDRGGKGGIYAERFPTIQNGIKVNLCPCMNGRSDNYFECCEYKKYTKKQQAIERRKAKSGNYVRIKREYIPVEIRHQVAAKYKFKCKYCGRSTRHVKCHVDHIIPLSRGGTNDIDNLCLACRDCNLRKYNKIYADNKGESLEGI